MKRVICACLLLTGCASLSNQAAPLPEASPPDQSVVQEGLKRAAVEAKLAGPLQWSPVRVANLIAPGSPGVFIACLRNEPPKQPSYPYSVFFKDNAYTTLRMSVFTDDCASQPYEPLAQPTPPAPAAKPAKPARSKK